MKKVDILNYLIDGVSEDIKYYIEYKINTEKASKEYEESNHANYWELCKKYNCLYPPVSKQKIKDTLKMIRRLSLEIEKGLNA